MQGQGHLIPASQVGNEDCGDGFLHIQSRTEVGTEAAGEDQQDRITQHGQEGQDGDELNWGNAVTASCPQE